LFGKTTEVAEFHELRLERIDHGESFHRLIQGQQFVRFGLDDWPCFAERKTLPAASVSSSTVPAGSVYERTHATTVV
jgi:hypothetical protein